ncbi:MAG: glycerate kinase type-2 family protein [Minisyncoccota bacterium]
MKIKNFKKLAVTEERKKLLKIVEAGLEAIDTKKAILNAVKIEKGKLLIYNHAFSLKNAEKIVVVGIGKCSLEAGVILEKKLGKRLTGGIVLDVHEGELKKIKTYTGDHPLMSPRNIDATKKIIELLSGLTEKDLVIFVISGGGSALLCQPKGFTCLEESAVADALIHSGADIYETNTVRKHLSLARGGFLAKYAYPARVVSLIFSDVIGDNLEFIASGPTVKDTTTLEQAEGVLNKYKIYEKCGLPPLNLIETPKDDKYFERVRNILFISNQTALDAMSEKSLEFGYMPRICKNNLTGEAKEKAKEIVDELSKENIRTVLFYGGETTVKIKGKGKGGRNQELSLSGLRYIKDNQILISVASDGRDNSENAGGICDIITKEKAKKHNLNIEKYLKNNDSYEFFVKTGDFLKTGDTGSNVADIIIAISN